jgi:glycosyltransferase involved in cell wall biosynthesis
MARPVALFVGDLSATGVARNTVHLAGALERRGIATEVICLEGGVMEPLIRGERITRLGRGSGPRTAALASRTAALRRRLIALEPACVLSMGNHAHLPLWAATRGLAHVPRAYRISNSATHAGETPARRMARQAGLKLIADDADRLICVSEALADLGPFSAARAEGRVVVAPNGVDVADICRRAERAVRHPWIQRGVRYVAAVGRIHPQKNYPALLDALARVRADGRDLRLMILGGGSNQAMAELTAGISARGLVGAVRLEGEVADPVPLLARAAAYALPSLWEGASNSLLEALACDVPVVASETAGAAAEVLGGGRYGRLVDPRDAGSIALALTQQAWPGPERFACRGRAAAFDLSERLAPVVDALCALGGLEGRAGEHDEIQMHAQPPRQPELVE